MRLPWCYLWFAATGLPIDSARVDDAPPDPSVVERADAVGPSASSADQNTSQLPATHPVNDIQAGPNQLVPYHGEPGPEEIEHYRLEEMRLVRLGNRNAWQQAYFRYLDAAAKTHGKDAAARAAWLRYKRSRPESDAEIAFAIELVSKITNDYPDSKWAKEAGTAVVPWMKAMAFDVHAAEQDLEERLLLLPDGAGEGYVTGAILDSLRTWPQQRALVRSRMILILERHAPQSTDGQEAQEFYRVLSFLRPESR